MRQSITIPLARAATPTTPNARAVSGFNVPVPFRRSVAVSLSMIRSISS